MRTEEQRRKRREYIQIPEVAKHRNKMRKIYRQRPEVRKQEREYKRINREKINFKKWLHSQMPEVKEAQRLYSLRPEVIERRNKHNHTPNAIKRRREYAKRPEVMERHKEREFIRNWKLRIEKTWKKIESLEEIKYNEWETERNNIRKHYIETLKERNDGYLKVLNKLCEEKVE
jgi:hypothetical protein